MKLPIYEITPPLKTEVPLVSVIMFCRNRVKFIKRAVDSIVRQLYPNWELIIQDGASTDGTREILESYKDPRIKLISEPDTGPFDAMWRAFRRCRGEIVGSCLSDEELLPHALSEGVQYFLCNPESAAIARDLALCDGEGNILGRYNCTEYNFLEYLSLHMGLTLQSALFRLSALEKIGFFTREWRFDCADFELISLLGERYRLDYYPGVVGKYCQNHEGQLSTTPEVGFFCALGQLQLIADFFSADPNKALLRDLPLVKAYGVIKRMYQAKKAGILEQKLDAFFAGLQVQGVADNLETAIQAIHAGKLDIAYRLYRERDPARDDYVQFQILAAEILELFCLPTEAMKLWSELADKGVAHAAERFLVTQLRTPDVNPVRILATQKRWAASQGTRLPSTDFKSTSASNSRPRLAFHASDWSCPDLRYQILPLLRCLSPEQFELFVYYSPGTDVERFPNSVKRMEVDDQSPVLFIEKVRADRIDVLVELSGLIPAFPFVALGGRCAPLQIVHLGFMATTGLRQIDCHLADPTICPPALEKLHTEKIVHLAPCYTAYQFPSISATLPGPRRLDDRFTFGCFSSVTLINSPLLECWGKMLKLVPSSRLLLASPDFNVSDCRTYIRNYFRNHQLAPESLLLLPRRPQEISPYLTAQIDLNLDTSPQNDPLSVACCLSRNIPSVTFAGSTMAGRLGASLLLEAGLRGCITGSLEEYCSVAAGLASQPDQLVKLRESLQSRSADHEQTRMQLFAEKFQTAINRLLTIR